MTTSSVRERVLRGAAVDELRGWVEQVEAWPAGSHVWGHYAEETATGPAICRTENVSVCHAGIAELVAGELRSIAADALGTSARDFKDKINYKHPGGAGFLAHQDRLAYPGVERVVSILLAVDDCSLESGCLWLAEDVRGELPVDDRGVVRDEVASTLTWVPAELAAGDAVCIDGLVPHYSDANRSASARRVLVVSYAPESEGYRREDYYAARRAVMNDRTDRDGRFRISTLADFAGAEVAPDDVAVEACTHG